MVGVIEQKFKKFKKIQLYEQILYSKRLKERVRKRERDIERLRDACRRSTFSPVSKDWCISRTLARNAHNYTKKSTPDKMS